MGVHAWPSDRCMHVVSVSGCHPTVWFAMQLVTSSDDTSFSCARLCCCLLRSRGSTGRSALNPSGRRSLAVVQKASKLAQRVAYLCCCLVCIATLFVLLPCLCCCVLFAMPVTHCRDNQLCLQPQVFSLHAYGVCSATC